MVVITGDKPFFIRSWLTSCPRTGKFDQVVFDFIEPDKDKQWHKHRLQITMEDELLVKQQIRYVWEKIRDHDFYTGCGKPDCNWCNFTKNNKLYLRLEEQDELTQSVVL